MKKEFENEKNQQQETTGVASLVVSNTKDDRNKWFIVSMVAITFNFIVIVLIFGVLMYFATNYDFGVCNTTQDSQGNSYNVVGSEGVAFGADK